MSKIIVYILLIAMGGYMAYGQIVKDRRCSQPAIATVVGRETKRVRGSRGRRTTHYTPVVEFATKEGQTVRAAADIDSIFAKKYKDGDTLEIRYNPHNPEEIVVQGKSFRSGVLGGGLLARIGIAGMILSLRK